MSTIVLTGGGTAGHIIPNLSLIPYLKPHFDKFYYIGTKGGMEEKLVQDAGLQFFGITTAKLKRQFTPDNFTIPFKIIKGFNQAKKVLKDIKPDVVFSKGGYVSVPVVYASKSLGIPVITHESDLSIGLANKIISPCAEKVLTAFPETAKQVDKGEFVGSPIRKDLFDYDKKSALAYYGFNGEKPIILVLGGSQGSKVINNCIESITKELLPRFDILHICGKGNLPTEKANGKVTIEFEPDIKKAFAIADLAVTRAGANSLFELFALNIPAVAIPLKKGASRGDQIQNADYFYKKGLLTVVYEENLTAESLLSAITSTYADRFNVKRRLSNTPFSSASQKIADILSTYIKN